MIPLLSRPPTRGDGKKRIDKLIGARETVSRETIQSVLGVVDKVQQLQQ
jgi:hypothetical protein